MHSNETITIGVLGLGHWGLNILRNFCNHPKIRVRYICDTSEKALTRAGQLVPDKCVRVKDAAPILEDPEVDAVYIALPHNFHYDIAKLCLLNGKHVI